MAPQSLAGRVLLLMTLDAPDRRRRDIDNYQKPVVDALMNAGCFEDDSQVDVLVTDRGQLWRGGRVHVVVVPMDRVERVVVELKSGERIERTGGAHG